jgi:hypothetical protein
MANKKKSFLYIGAAIVVAVFVFIFVYFEPQKVFIDDKADEELIGEVVQPAPEEEAPGETDTTSDTTPAPVGGEFQSRGNYTTTGTVLITQSDDTTFVRLQDLETDNGPDLKVYIAKDLEEDGTPIDSVDLGDLKGNIGSSNYEVPSDVDIADYNYVVIWCKRFSTSFGDAPI